MPLLGSTLLSLLPEDTLLLLRKFVAFLANPLVLIVSKVASAIQPPIGIAPTVCLIVSAWMRMGPMACVLLASKVSRLDISVCLRVLLELVGPHAESLLRIAHELRAIGLLSGFIGFIFGPLIHRLLLLALAEGVIINHSARLDLIA